MRNLFLFTLITVLFVSCQNDVGRYEVHDDFVFDNKTGTFIEGYVNSYTSTKTGEEIYYTWSKRVTVGTGGAVYEIHETTAEAAGWVNVDSISREQIGK